jgi:FkbM family methyltransferase
MMDGVKALVRRAVAAGVALMRATRIGRFAYAQILRSAMGSARRVTHRGVELLFATPNAVNVFRAETFSTKEPETLDWIDSMPEGSVLWDIGANVGLYTCYAARARRCRVFAFEPSVFNLELLARNIFLNDLLDRATIVPLPLSDGLAVSRLNMTSTEWGGALSTFGHDYGHDGKVMDRVFAFDTVGMSMVHARELLGIPHPQYVKMDVDGIEHLILRGGADVLRSVKGVLIEINDDFTEHAEEAALHLSSAGLELREKRRWDGTDDSPFATTFNQIWHRPEAAQ